MDRGPLVGIQRRLHGVVDLYVALCQPDVLVPCLVGGTDIEVVVGRIGGHGVAVDILPAPGGGGGGLASHRGEQDGYGMDPG